MGFMNLKTIEKTLRMTLKAGIKLINENKIRDDWIRSSGIVDRSSLGTSGNLDESESFEGLVPQSYYPWL